MHEALSSREVSPGWWLAYYCVPYILNRIENFISVVHIPIYISISTMPQLNCFHYFQIPLDLMMQISSISNVSEFIDRFVDKKTIDPRDGILNGE